MKYIQLGLVLMLVMTLVLLVTHSEWPKPVAVPTKAEMKHASTCVRKDHGECMCIEGKPLKSYKE